MKNGYAKQKNAKDTSVYKMRSQGYTEKLKYTKMLRKKKKREEGDKQSLFSRLSPGTVCASCPSPAARPLIYVTLTGGRPVEPHSVW